MQNNNKKAKRIGFDARFYGPLNKGLGRYTKEVIDNILKIDKDHEYVIFLGKDNFQELKTDNPKVKKVLADIKWYTLSEQIIMPWYIWRENLDLVHFPHFNVPIFCPVKFIVTIHDLILTKFPTQRATTLSPFFYWLKDFAYKIVIKRAVRQAKKIIAVSTYTKNDIANKFKARSDKIIVTYEGVFPSEIKNRQNDKKVLLRYNIDNPYLLYVGNAYPHKNLEGLINIFFRIIGKYNNLSLVLVGKEDYFYNRIKEFVYKSDNYKEKIILPGFVPDNDLVFFYQNALAYIFPSFYEGFGLPPLEAMTFGCPVVSSNKASLPEVLGKAALYFNPEDKKEMQERIEQIIKDKNLRKELVKKGYEQIKKYNWLRCAEQTIEIYKLIL